MTTCFKWMPRREKIQKHGSWCQDNFGWLRCVAKIQIQYRRRLALGWVTDGDTMQAMQIRISPLWQRRRGANVRAKSSINPGSALAFPSIVIIEKTYSMKLPYDTNHLVCDSVWVCMSRPVIGKEVYVLEVGHGIEALDIEFVSKST